MSDWVNWQQFSDLNKSSQQEQADMREQQRQQEQADINRIIGGLRQEQATARSREAKGGLPARGIESLASYSDAMLAADKGMAAAKQRNAMAAAPWETEMSPGMDRSSPWEDFARRMGGLQADDVSWTDSRKQNKATAEAAAKAQQERAAKDADTKQKFYAQTYADMPGKSLTEDDKRRRAQMLGYASERGEWNGPTDPYARGALWETGFGTGSPFKTGHFDSPQNRYDAPNQWAPKKPSGWNGW